MPTCPERHYDLAGHIIARAVEDAARDGVPVLDTLRRAATDAGRKLGAQSRTPPGKCEQRRRPRGASGNRRAGRAGIRTSTPGRHSRTGQLPVPRLAGEHSALVCGMNLDLITAMLDELGCPELEAKFDPAPGRCCVTLVAST